MNIKKGLAYVFLATGIGFVINLATNFLLPKFLSVETYADIKLYQLYITYIGILHLGFSDGMYLRLGGKKLKDIDTKELLSEFKTFKIFQLVINIIALVYAVLMKNIILISVAVSIIPVNAINYLRNLYQATGLYDLYSKFTTTNNMMLFIINILLLFVAKSDNPNVYIVGNVIVYFLNWLLIEFVIRKKVFYNQKAKTNIRYLFSDIKSGILLMLGNFCSVIFTSIDRMYVKYILGTVQFAYYSFAVSVEGLLNTFITPVVVTMYNYLCNNNIPEKILKIKRLLLIVVSLLLASAFPVKWVINTFITRYQMASNIIFILFTAQFFTIIVKCIHTNLYKAEKKQSKYFKIIIIISILAVIFDWLACIINKSNEGFAVATLIVSILWFVIGEMEFKNSRFKVKDYSFMIIILSVYLVTGLGIVNAIIGCIIYIILTVINIKIFLEEELNWLLKEIEKYIKKYYKFPENFFKKLLHKKNTSVIIKKNLTKERKKPK